jgi:hypothetical protein
MAQNKTGEAEVTSSGMNLMFGFVYATLLLGILKEKAHGFIFV